MQISRLEKEGKVEWQVKLEDSEMTCICHAIMTGFVGARMSPANTLIAELALGALLTKTNAKDPDVLAYMAEASTQAAGRFIVDVTRIASEFLKE